MSLILIVSGQAVNAQDDVASITDNIKEYIYNLTRSDIDKGIDAYNKKDYKTAISFWKPLAVNGDVKAQYNLGMMYLFGKGVAQDNKQAFHWYQKAAEQEDASAQFFIGRFYEYGKGITKNDKQAVYWFEKSANQGHMMHKIALQGCISVSVVLLKIL